MLKDRDPEDGDFWEEPSLPAILSKRRGIIPTNTPDYWRKTE
jgi:hypothetical protein